MEAFINEHPVWFAILLIIIVWDLVWRVISMWHAARRNEKGWFIVLSIISSIGLLPIVYLFNRNILKTAAK